MERAKITCRRHKFWFAAFAGFILWSGFIFLFNSDAISSRNEILMISSSTRIDDRVFPSEEDGVDGQSIDSDHAIGDVVGEGSGDALEVEESGKDSRNTPVKRSAATRKVKKQKAKTRNNPKKRPVLSASKAKGSGSAMNVEEPHMETRNTAGKSSEADKEMVRPDPVACAGRYILVHRLPRRFNEDLIRSCRSLSPWTDMCAVLSNAGLGPQIQHPGKILPRHGWYASDQFSLEVIFHNRMKQYDCLTDDPTLASAVFVPYYAGIDVARYLWFNASAKVRDSGMRDLVRWLKVKPEWEVLGGRDHFMVAGRIGWDFRREYESDSDWGTNLLLLPESQRMMVLVLESTLIYDGNDYAIPYPTYFHPSSNAEVERWQNRMRRQRREFLFSFAGGPRLDKPDSIRGQVIDQCRNSPKQRCKLLECGLNGSKCYRPIDLMQLFQNSVFCLQPQGDSYTRRSSFDSILGGCIPVFFHAGSFYEQYKWHLPEDHREYSVFIPEDDVRDGKVSIEGELSRIPTKRVWAMRKAVIQLIPSVVYADPRSNGMTLDDAFNITVKGVLERIKRLREEVARR
ncbi:hypothetical protein MLD38_017352 [Melastoma candidum]|uniref:Uncharacterized protein n=1 Tax=Melastoma candidum TaxID=119954 RepID=A0ACB9QQW8_9MYRT|nr:hypothetical protein MLD38_017352 [Melastoma candidum]